MGVKYVKEFMYPSDGGFHKGAQPMKARDSYKDMPARAKPNAPAKGAPKMESKPKMGKGQGYAMGGMVPGYDMDRLPVKKPPGRGMDLAPSMPERGMYEGYAKGGMTKGEKKVGKVMREYKKGELHSGSKKGPVVKNRKQAVAIALSEARKAGAKIPKKAEGGIFNDEDLAYGNKKVPYRGSPRKAKMLGRKDRMERLARRKMEHAEKYAPGLSLDMPDKKANGGEIKKAVHKHERSKHPGESLTKLRKGGVPSYGRKPMYGSD